MPPCVRFQIVLEAGFDRSLDMKNQGNFFTSAGNSIDDVPVKPPADEKGYYSTIATADHAIDCLKDHAANHAGKPFFHYISFIAPHFPLHALPQDIAKYRDKYLAGWEVLRATRFVRQQTMGITKTTLSALERNVGPPYAFPEAMKKLGVAWIVSVSAVGSLQAKYHPCDIVLPNLLPGTTYIVQARAGAGGKVFSEWSDPVSHMCT